MTRKINLYVVINIILTIFLLFTAAMYYETIRIPPLTYYLIATPFSVFLIPYTIFFLAGLIYRQVFSYKLSGLLMLLVLFTQFYIVGRPHFVNTVFRAPSQDEKIRICSWNTAYFFDFDRDAGFKLLEENDCDVIALQEVWHAKKERIEVEKYRNIYFQGKDIRLEDEFAFIIPPVSDKHIYKSKSGGYYGLELNIKGHSFVLLNAHIWNPVAYKPFYDQNNRIKYLGPIEIRHKHETELKGIVSNLVQGDTPIILVGDFNAQPNIKFIRDISKIGDNDKHLILTPVDLLTNHNSYPAKLRLIQIDYAYVSSRIRPEASLELKCYDTASDHCLLILDVLL